MKILKKIFLITLSTSFFIACSPDSNKNTEVRFVDLQGNARAIKTRVPEANARIMSGQSVNSSDLSNEKFANKKNFVEAPSYYNKNSINQKNISGPKFSDDDNFAKTYQFFNLAKIIL